MTIGREITSAKNVPPPEHIDDASAWTAETISQDDWFFKLGHDALSEIRELAQYFDRTMIEIEAILPDDFQIPACRQLMAEVKFATTKGPRFAVIDRLPLDDISESAASRVNWVLMSLIARPVAQKLDETFVFPVRDTGKKFVPGSGVRPATTNIEQNFHNDNCFNGLPPEFVTLTCIHPAADGGGVSRLVSLTTAYNIISKHHSHILPRLCQPFYFDRQLEHPEDEETTISQPLFSFEDGLKVRLGASLVRAGYAVRNEPIDEEGQKALEVLTEVVEDPALWFEDTLERGQIQIVNNRETGHARTRYVDAPDKPRRHLERLWLRNAGRRTYLG